MLRPASPPVGLLQVWSLDDEPQTQSACSLKTHTQGPIQVSRLGFPGVAPAFLRRTLTLENYCARIWGAGDG